MSPMVDPVSSINKMYQEAGRKVPYPVFMNCFDKLLKSPPKLDPAPPSSDLKPYFHALCQAVDMGVADPRGNDRAREFREKVLPAWKASLPPAEFAEFQQILDGTARKKMAEDKRAQERRAAEESDKRFEEEIKKMGKEDMHAQFSRLAEQAMADEDAAEEAEKSAAEGGPDSAAAGAAAPTDAAAPPAAGAEAAAGAAKPAAVPLLNNVEALVNAFAEKKIPIRYSSMEDKKPYVQYMLGQDKITLQIVKTPNSYYLVLNSPRGYADKPDAAEKMTDLAAQMGYRETQPLTYEVVRGDHAFKLKLGRKSTYIACKRKSEFAPEFVVKALHELHADLAAIVLKFEGGQAAAGGPPPAQE